MNEINFVFDIFESIILSGSGCACIHTQDGTLYIADKKVDVREEDEPCGC
jgi:hypothetical protein